MKRKTASVQMFKSFKIDYAKLSDPEHKWKLKHRNFNSIHKFTPYVHRVRPGYSPIDINEPNTIVLNDANS